MLNLKEIKSSVDIIDIIGRRITLTGSGARRLGLCPFHGEKTPSFTVDGAKQFFKCFGCGKSGDVIDFFTLQGKSLTEAVAEINNTPTEPLAAPRYTPGAKWETTKPDFLPKEIRHFEYGVPNETYTYRDLEGSVYAYTCRFNLPNGKKEVLPYSFCVGENGKRGWMWKGLDRPRMLYNLHTIPNAQIIIIVEGEKTANALNRILSGTLPVISWIGGSDGVKNADFSPLTYKDLILWPDNDDPGLKAMDTVANQLKPHVNSIRQIRNPKDAPQGWDFADCDWDYNTTTNYIKNNLFYVKQPA